MSRAGKFIPGGGGNKAGDAANRTAPIRAPEPGGPVPEGTATRKIPVKGSSLIRPVQKNQRLPIVIMSAAVCCLLVSVAWYEFAVVPTKRAQILMQQQMQKQIDDALAAKKKAQDDLVKQEAVVQGKRATLTVDSKTPGAVIIIGNAHKTAPATFDNLTAGTVNILIQADGYEDYRQDVAVNVDKPTDLGTISLVEKVGSLSISSPQTEVEYSLAGPGNFTQQGKVPAELKKLPAGDYQLTVWQHDWKLEPITLTIHDQEDVDKEIKFPYGNVTITSVPSGATVRQDHAILGKTPFSLNNLRPGDLHFSVDLPPYEVEQFDVHVSEFGNISKPVTLLMGKNFTAACGMPMLWIPDGNFWAGKYLVRQSDFETVAGYNPSFFRRPNRPVEQISWDAAMAFCDKLNAYERKEGKLPAGFHYALPTESQWSTFSADADINQAPMSRNNALTSTQDVGASEPNKYGLYDTLGNVWEWCIDTFDDKGDHSLRGGSWLSSGENFPSSDTREAGGPKYQDRFTGFRVVLVPN